jgi:hypothetical protein
VKKEEYLEEEGSGWEDSDRKASTSPSSYVGIFPLTKTALPQIMLLILSDKQVANNHAAE